MLSQFMTGSGITTSNGIGTSCRLTFRRVSTLLFATSVLAVAPAFAKDRPAPTNQSQTQTEAQAKTVAIPECMAKLNLTPEQKTQIEEIVHNYDTSVSLVWKKFEARYMQAIEMETALLAAIEDNLTESQRQTVREQRRKLAQSEKSAAATTAKVNQSPARANEDTTKPATAAEEGLAAVGVSLTDEQQDLADEVQDNYQAQLRSLNRDIEGLHTRLVSLEADKLVEIEKVLTKEQLTQLRVARQSPPASQKVASSRIRSTKSE